MLSMIGHPSGAEPLMVDVRQSGSGPEGFVIIEARRYTKGRQKQEQVAALAYRIIDTEASGAILVSPLGFQEGARKVAEAEGVQEVLMSADTTPGVYLLGFLNKVFMGAAGSVSMPPLRIHGIVTVTPPEETQA
jgi:hypothetical protein